MTEPGDADPRWATVDELLFSGARLPALVAAREAFDWSLEQAIDRVPVRWQRLVETAPQSFTVPIEGYWDRVYT